jgi:hypothetical protein
MGATRNRHRQIGGANDVALAPLPQRCQERSDCLVGGRDTARHQGRPLSTKVFQCPRFALERDSVLSLESLRYGADGLQVGGNLLFELLPFRIIPAGVRYGLGHLGAYGFQVLASCRDRLREILELFWIGRDIRHCTYPSCGGLRREAD